MHVRQIAAGLGILGILSGYLLAQPARGADQTRDGLVLEYCFEGSVPIGGRAQSAKVVPLDGEGWLIAVDRWLDPGRMCIFNSGRWDGDYHRIGSLSNPGSPAWESDLRDVHGYPDVPHEQSAGAREPRPRAGCRPPAAQHVKLRKPPDR
jgi:hypothetical protein